MPTLLTAGDRDGGYIRRTKDFSDCTARVGSITRQVCAQIESEPLSAQSMRMAWLRGSGEQVRMAQPAVGDDPDRS
jgi:hypothetical protein